MITTGISFFLPNHRVKLVLCMYICPIRFVFVCTVCVWCVGSGFPSFLLFLNDHLSYNVRSVLYMCIFMSIHDNLDLRYSRKTHRNCNVGIFRQKMHFLGRDFTPMTLKSMYTSICNIPNGRLANYIVYIMHIYITHMYLTN